MHLIVPVLLVPCWAPFGTAAQSSALQRPSQGSVASHRTHARPLCLEQLAHGALRRLRCSSKQLRASSIHCIHRLKMLSSGVGFETAAVASNTRVSARRSLFLRLPVRPERAGSAKHTRKSIIASIPKMRMYAFHFMHRLKVPFSRVDFEIAAVVSNICVSTQRSHSYAYRRVPWTQAQPTRQQRCNCDYSLGIHVLISHFA